MGGQEGPNITNGEERRHRQETGRQQKGGADQENFTLERNANRIMLQATTQQSDGMIQ